MSQLNQTPYQVPNKPSELGFNLKGDEWRPQQKETVERILNSDKKLIVVAAPTGSGKSVTALAAGRILHGNTTILTHRKGLQQQYADYTGNHVIATGRNNHPCVLGGFTDETAATAPCVDGYKCPLKEPKLDTDGVSQGSASIPCPYYKQLAVAKDSKIRVLNYPLFLLTGEFTSDMIICDEGHRVDKEILNAGVVELTRTDQKLLNIYARKFPFPITGRYLDDSPHVLDWYHKVMNTLKWRFFTQHKGIDKPEWLSKLYWKMAGIEPLFGKKTVLVLRDGIIKFAPVLPQEHAQEKLLSFAPKIVLLSASIFGYEYWADLLGVAHSDAEFIDVPSTFPIDNRPISVIPVMWMNKHVLKREASIQKVVDVMDEFILQHFSEKILIHSVSYTLTDFIMERSKFREMMIRGDSDGAIELFKEQDHGVLVSPRALEGLDFFDDLCRLVIFPKVPWLSQGDPVVEAQMELIDGFYNYEAMSGIVQGAGRGVRSDTDWCNTIILDKSFEKLLKDCEGWLPQWFRDAIVPGRNPLK